MYPDFPETDMAPENYSWGNTGFRARRRVNLTSSDKYVNLFVGAQLSANVGQLPINSYIYIYIFGGVSLYHLSKFKVVHQQNLYDLKDPTPTPSPTRPVVTSPRPFWLPRLLVRYAHGHWPPMRLLVVSKGRRPKVWKLQIMGHNHPQLEDKDFNLWEWRFSCFSSRFHDGFFGELQWLEFWWLVIHFFF